MEQGDNPNERIQIFPATQPRRINIREAENKSKTWKRWYQEYQFYVAASGIHQLPKEMQVGNLMNCLGPDILDIFESFELNEAEKKDPEIIIKRFSEEFDKSHQYQTYNTYVFFNTNQEDGQSFEDYLIDLKMKIKLCDFNTVQNNMTLEDRLLRDKLILGVKSSKVREKLLSDPKLDLSKAISICRASEQTSEQLSHIAGHSKICDVIKEHEEQKNKTKNSELFFCRRCGTKHGIRQCKAYNKKCECCGKKGHLTEKCFKNRKEKKKFSNQVEVESETTEDELEEFNLHLHAIFSSNTDNDDWLETIRIEGKNITVNLDTGAKTNVMPKKYISELDIDMKKSNIKNIISFNQEKTKVLGKINTNCMVKGKQFMIEFQVVDLDTIPVLGDKACVELGLIKRIHQVGNFSDGEIYKGLGCFKNFEYKLEFRENPIFSIHPARSIPHRIRDEVKAELDNMVKLGVIIKQDSPTPVVSNLVIVKKGKKLRICMDPTDLNRNILRRHYPLSTIEEISARIRNSTWFTILDCKRGFWQVKVSEESVKYLTFSTPWGRYSYQRLPFGLCSAPEVFQNLISSILQKFKNVEVSMDDILIHASSVENLRLLTKKVMEVLFEKGVRLNKEKCQFDKQSIKFLGHIVTAKGLKPDPDKIDAINRLKTPTDKKALQRLLGMVTYLSKFISNLSEITKPLRQLLVKNVEWCWGHEQEVAFETIKMKLCSLPVLKYYDVNKNNILSVDSSSFAMGVTLLQDGHPIAYASKALSLAQQAYPQIEKEALAIRFGCQKFHPFIFGKEVLVETDHKPLQSIFTKPLDRAPARLKRIILDVQPYGVTVKYKKGNDIPIPDALSRDVNNLPEDENENELEVNLILPITVPWAKQIGEEINKSDKLKKLKLVIENGWPDCSDDISVDVKEFWNFRDELSVYEGLIFKGDKILIPSTLKYEVLQLIHQGHFGIQSCIKRARQLVFWVNMAKDIQDFVSRCEVCQKHARKCDKESLLLHKIPEFPFQIVGIDVFSYGGKQFLVLIDSYSGWLDFAELRTLESSEVIKILKNNWFSVFGIPDECYSDNGRQFTSQLFKKFVAEWKFTHKLSSPYYPKSNGLSERAVQIVKNILKKCAEDNTSPRIALMNYRNTPRSDELLSPNERLMSRATKTLLPVNQKQLVPKVVKDVPKNLEKERKRQKIYHDRTAGPEREMPQVQDKVMIQNPISNTWKSGVVKQHESRPRAVLIETDDGGNYIRNTIHVRKVPSRVESKQLEKLPEELPQSPSTGMVPEPQMIDRPDSNLVSRPNMTRYGRVVRAPQRYRS